MFSFHVGKIRQLLIEPAATIHDAAARRAARLLAIFLLAMAAVFTIYDLSHVRATPGYQVAWYGYLFLAVAYWLSRTRHYEIAASLAVAMFPTVVFSNLIQNTALNPTATLNYLVVGLLFGSIFLSARGLAALAIVDIAGLLLLPTLAPAAVPSFEAVAGPLTSTAVASVLALVFLHHRDRLEWDRQAELRAALDIARASEERYRAISEVTSDYAFSYRIATDGAITLDWVTDAMTRILGYTPEEVRSGDSWNAMIFPEDLPIVMRRRRRLHAGQTDVSEYRVFAKDRRVLWLRFYSRPVWDAAQGRVVRVYGAAQDVTRIKQLEQQLTQAQKMEAVGRLAGGIAHDFNNLLVVIGGSAELLLDTLSPDDPRRAEAGQIQQTVARAAAFTRQLLAFSRQQTLQPQLLDLNALIVGMEPILRRLAGLDVRLVMHLAAEIGPVFADPGQLEQVVLNLVINARDAMPGGGTLTIRTAAVTVDETNAHAHIGVAGGAYTTLMVSDTGCGMDSATLAHIFEPFFTTKPQGKGTGLGLATVHGIITQSGGHIRVYSEPGHGATFVVYLGARFQ